MTKTNTPWRESIIEAAESGDADALTTIRRTVTRGTARKVTLRRLTEYLNSLDSGSDAEVDDGPATDLDEFVAAHKEARVKAREAQTEAYRAKDEDEKIPSYRDFHLLFGTLPAREFDKLSPQGVRAAVREAGQVPVA